MKLTDFKALTFEGFGATMNPGAMPHYDVRFTSLGDLASAVKAEAGGA